MMFREMRVGRSGRSKRSRWWLAGMALAAGLASALTGCAQQRFERMFDERMARQALACSHPAGEFRSAGEVKADGADAFTGVIYWRGKALENDYVTKVRIKVEGGVAKVFVIEDSALVPALSRNCEISLPR